jgi:hypothetical protein
MEVRHDSHVDRTAGQIAEQCVVSAIDGLDIHLRKSAMVFAECRTQISGRRRSLDTEDETPVLPSASRLQPNESRVSFRDDVARGRQELSACSRWPRAAIRPFE